MGMDVSGNAPKNDAGFYFRATVWTWHPLAEMLEELYPDLIGEIEYLHSNDGDGLNEEDADELGRRLAGDLRTGRMRTGRIRAWLRRRDAALVALPDEACRSCAGTGTRTDEVGVSEGMAKKGWCNACDGKGTHRPCITAYQLDLEDVETFAKFVAGSGGFEIC